MTEHQQAKGANVPTVEVIQMDPTHFDVLWNEGGYRCPGCNGFLGYQAGWCERCSARESERLAAWNSMSREPS